MRLFVNLPYNREKKVGANCTLLSLLPSTNIVGNFIQIVLILFAFVHLNYWLILGELFRASFPVL